MREGNRESPYQRDDLLDLIKNNGGKAEGLDLSDGSEILLRDDPKSFAEACLHLLKDPDSCRHLSSSAYTKVHQLYDRKKIVRLIQEHIQPAVKPVPEMFGGVEGCDRFS